MPFVLIIFSFISVFLCLQLIIISPKINIQSSFFFIYQCLTVMLVSFTMPANGLVYEKCEYIKPMFRKGTKIVGRTFVCFDAIKSIFYIHCCMQFLLCRSMFFH